MEMPTLLQVEKDGTTVVLHVRARGGERLLVRCGPKENFQPSRWQWTRDGERGVVSFTERDGREYRFAVKSDRLLAECQALVRRPVA